MKGTEKGQEMLDMKPEQRRFAIPQNSTETASVKANHHKNLDYNIIINDLLKWWPEKKYITNLWIMITFILYLPIEHPDMQ